MEFTDYTQMLAGTYGTLGKDEMSQCEQGGEIQVSITIKFV